MSSFVLSQTPHSTWACDTCKYQVDDEAASQCPICKTARRGSSVGVSYHKLFSLLVCNFLALISFAGRCVPRRNVGEGLMERRRPILYVLPCSRYFSLLCHFLLCSFVRRRGEGHQIRCNRRSLHGPSERRVFVLQTTPCRYQQGNNSRAIAIFLLSFLCTEGDSGMTVWPQRPDRSSLSACFDLE